MATKNLGLDAIIKVEVEKVVCKPLATAADESKPTTQQPTASDSDDSDSLKDFQLPTKRGRERLQRSKLYYGRYEALSSGRRV